MTGHDGEREARRDRALEDLLDVDRQLAAGELTTRDAEQLRARYRAEALAAIRSLSPGDVAVADRIDKGGEEVAPPPPERGRRVRVRHLLYALALVVAVATAVLVTRNVLDRPPGGLVSGNEVMLGNPGAGAMTTEQLSRPRRLSKVTDAQLEAVVAANPEMTGLRLALAQRYADRGRYDLALVHYGKVLELDPGNAEAQAHIGWINLMVGRPDEAARLVDSAVQADPENPDAVWFQANVRLYGLDDPAGALEALDRMETIDGLGPRVGRQVARLRAEASAKLEDR